MKIMKQTLFILIIAFLFTACGGKADSLKVTDPTKPIQVNAGDEFQILIEANATTGYHWEIIGELDKVEFVGNDYTSTSEAGLVGGGGVELWTFKAINAGETQVFFGYFPPSNDPTDPQQITTFTVIVK